MARRNKPDPFIYEAMQKRSGTGGGPGFDTDCGKKGYRSSSDAESVMRHRESESGDKLDIYSCDRCGNWHITSQTW